MMSAEKLGRCKAGIEGRMETRERLLALKNKTKSEKRLEVFGGLSEAIGMKTYVHGPMDLAKTLKLRFRVGGPGPAKKKGVPVYQ